MAVDGKQLLAARAAAERRGMRGSRQALRRWQGFLAMRGVALEQELASGSTATTASSSAAAAAEKTEEGVGDPRVLSAIIGIIGTSL
jgi:hypothetical protein